ncbi:SDR family oxidoreductase [Bacillus sp. T33-2]|uniref:SDR family oxidoreductase n=1 Tax=Bacillus sp. T33-2 TaxID=2054168 RepID=UPI000C78558D|nr:SDR family oxidoreductase [Bacillus sp. T33-2]PLR92023.1 3-oxoacyl-ACP reductase [Bacillus sp. T33-2]
MSQGLLAGKTAIVTGAGSGMGAATARLFADQGANVVLADINEEAAAQIVGVINDGRAMVVKTDVTDEASVSNLISNAAEAFVGIDILVNCAGVPQSFIPIEEMALEQWDRIIGVNTKSIFLTVKHVIPFMKKHNRGSIINIASIAGVRARPGLNAYCASKGAAIMLTKALALELAPNNIRVNAINPGPAETPMLDKFLPGNTERAEDEKKRIFVDSVPLGKLIQPEDIANGVLYLASDQAKMITGEILNIDGGRGI